MREEETVRRTAVCLPFFTSGTAATTELPKPPQPYSRCSRHRDQRDRPTQSGFRAGRCCIAQILNLRRVLVQHCCLNNPSLTASSTSQLHLIKFTVGHWWIMKSIPDKLLRLIQSYYEQTTNRNSGGRAGWAPPPPPTLYNYAVDWVLNSALTGFKWVQVGLSC